MAPRDARDRGDGIASRIRPKQVVFGIVTILLVVFTLLNTRKVTVNFFGSERDVSLIVVIVVSAALGALVGWLAPRLRRDD